MPDRSRFRVVVIAPDDELPCARCGAELAKQEVVIVPTVSWPVNALYPVIGTAPACPKCNHELDGKLDGNDA